MLHGMHLSPFGSAAYVAKTAEFRCKIWLCANSAWRKETCPSLDHKEEKDMIFFDHSQVERRKRRVRLQATRRDETYPPRPHRGLFFDHPRAERRDEIMMCPPPARDRTEKSGASYGTFRESVGRLV
jgi:hypothetical protein